MVVSCLAEQWKTTQSGKGRGHVALWPERPRQLVMNLLREDEGGVASAQAHTTTKL